MKEKNIMNMKERIENFHNLENELRSAIIDKIKSEFEKYHSDKVSIFYPNFNELGYEDYVIPTLYHFIDDCGSDPTQPIYFKKENDNLVVECDYDISIYLLVNNYEMTVDDLYSLLVLLQHPLTKKANNK